MPLVKATVTVLLSWSAGVVKLATTKSATVAPASSTTAAPAVSVKVGASLTAATSFSNKTVPDE